MILWDEQTFSTWEQDRALMALDEQYPGARIEYGRVDVFPVYGPQPLLVFVDMNEIGERYYVVAEHGTTAVMEV